MSPLYFNLDMLYACDVILFLEFPTPRLLQGPAVSPFRSTLILALASGPLGPCVSPVDLPADSLLFPQVTQLL